MFSSRRNRKRALAALTLSITLGVLGLSGLSAGSTQPSEARNVAGRGTTGWQWN